MGLALFASACGASETHSVSDAGAPAPASAQSGGSGEGGGSGEAGFDRAESAEAPSSAEGGGERRQTEQVQAVPTERAIVYTAQMTVRAEDVAASAETAKRIVTAAGGYLSQEKSDAFGGGEASSTLVFKIPPAGYPGVVDRFGKELGKRESVQQNTEDVTEEVADVESRLKSARSALDSLRALLKRADTIGQVLEVEREISNREAELESLQARQKKLASLTGMATLTLNLIGPVAEAPEPPEEEPGGFLSGLEAGWDAFVTTVKVGLTVLGALLPWLLVIVPVWLAIALGLRRSRRRRPEPPAPSGPLAPGPVPPGPVTPDTPRTPPGPAPSDSPPGDVSGPTPGARSR
ncbi:hypothetical protein Ppa06_44920 [Planomonospora parontospora subsp. parontospora]|uniref:DUF4349 domain-containing protein n=2 Tax=Planomonospora parontospora TaxID=58119 RepID=A0AA37F6J7_9ACTN|nr:hypothetical protein GCM10010126_50780 [Planomonospora parontospora]GII10694.1 hypothetical protein Ppa06_44920 [Planomonospora parontospora subsp. parontospora]